MIEHDRVLGDQKCDFRKLVGLRLSRATVESGLDHPRSLESEVAEESAAKFRRPGDPWRPPARQEPLQSSERICVARLLKDGVPTPSDQTLAVDFDTFAAFEPDHRHAR
ncbi:MAG TPA: hypothetical protein VIF40_19590 [Methylosinus sp.]